MQNFWSDKEVVDLFDLVGQIKQKNKPLCYAFVLHANKYNRKPNSVKNYYYYELKNLKTNTTRLKRLGVNVDELDIVNHISFDKDETNSLIKEIDQQVKRGRSIRSVCYELSKGDINKMQRYQNKYYNTKKKELDEAKVINIKEHKNKVLSTLSDKDITALFLGLVRLIKTEATKEVNTQLKQECEFATANYQKVLSLLKQKESEVDKLKSINKTLNEQLSMLKSSNNIQLT